VTAIRKIPSWEGWGWVEKRRKTEDRRYRSKKSAVCSWQNFNTCKIRNQYDINFKNKIIILKRLYWLLKILLS